ncbi:MAG: RNA polymerase sigma factor [bacterium]|nr:RNA polymerase sigma factor [bacterium]
MEKLTDEQLAAAYLKGEREALNFLIKRYLKPIYNFAFNYVKDQAAAEDLTQEVFVKVWQKIKKYNNQYKFKSWLYAITKNTCLDYLKKHKAVNFSALESADGFQFEELVKDSSPTAHDQLELAHEAALVQAAVNQLPEKYKKTIKLHYLEGYKFREIAGLLKESIEAVKTRNRRALIKLKKLIIK